ncbi:MAG TPA: CoA-binding protein [Pleomorphomonadaceae bacterium]|nr:CoA-binding protein [Pleomorphomonadaceae bacterium]
MTFADPETIERVLRETQTWAVVGCSSNPIRPSHGVARTLMDYGYRMIPVNPRETQVHGQTAYADLFSAQADAVAAGHPIEVVDIFRNLAVAGIHVDEAVEIGAKAVWMQLGVIDEEAAERAHAAGLWVVMDRCPAIELPRLSLGA